MEENFERSENQESTTLHQEHEQESGPDRLSQLPEHLLLEILSLLDMRDAVKTCVVSKMWKDLWTQVDKIVFEYADESIEKTPQFISRVEHTLKGCTYPNLKKFVLVWPHDDISLDVLDRWLQWVSKKNLEYFKVEMPLYYYCPPECFYHNSSLLELDISSFIFKIAGQAAGWTSLKRLCLKFVYIDDEMIAKVILGCPVLETLCLDEIQLIHRLNVNSPSMKKLIVINFPDDGLEINAPCIQELDIGGCFFGPRFQLIDLSSLEYAAFDHVELTPVNGKVVWRADAVATKILQRIVHVKKVMFGPLFIQALSLVKQLGGTLPLFKCKHVTVRLSFLGCELPGIACLLNSSPGLETLIINVVTPSEVSKEKLFQKYYSETLDFFENLFQTSNTESLDFNEDEHSTSMEGRKFLGLKNIKVS